MAEKVIIDTDPAMGVPFRDVDDGLAIAMALRSPELDVVGITLTYGNTSLKKAERSARRLLKVAGREDVPLLRGAESKRELGRGTEASRFIADTLGASPGEVSLLTLGPATNAATAEMNSTGVLSAARRVVAMGGAVFGPGMIPPFFLAEFNFYNDPKATDIFIQSCADLTLVPCELTTRVSFTGAYMRRLRKAGTPLADYAYSQALPWYALMSALLLRDGFPPHDPLAVGWMIRPDIYEVRDAQIKTTVRGPARGWLRRARGGANVRVAVDVARREFLDLLVGRVSL